VTPPELSEPHVSVDPSLRSTGGDSVVVADEVEVHFRGRSTLRRPGQVVRAVDGVSLELVRGETLGLVGESGCGKSTFGRALVRLVPITGGSVTVDGLDVTHARGKDLLAVRRKTQMIFQDPVGSLNPRMRVGDIVAAGLEIHGVGDRTERGDSVRKALADVGLAGLEGRLPHQLSGGQRQRVGIARALVLRPAVIVADEPVSALDVSVQSQVLNLLVETKDAFGLTYFFIAHNLAAVAYISDRIAVMYLGKVVEIARPAQLLGNPLHPYTAALISAIPEVHEHGRRRIVLHGDVPSPVSPPSGCRFRTRCPLAQPVCTEIPPPLAPVAGGRAVACHFAGHPIPGFKPPDPDVVARTGG
jgi:oligopeptide/dipeptide ABC transporter ATP-binding protein